LTWWFAGSIDPTNEQVGSGCLTTARMARLRSKVMVSQSPARSTESRTACWVLVAIWARKPDSLSCSRPRRWSHSVDDAGVDPEAIAHGLGQLLTRRARHRTDLPGRARHRTGWPGGVWRRTGCPHRARGRIGLP